MKPVLSAVSHGKKRITKTHGKEKKPGAIRCMIVDDEPHAIDLLKRHIESTPSLQLVHATTHAQEILERAEKEPFDLLFLDVEMPLLTGFDLLGLLKGKCCFVLCSGHRKYALEGFEHDVCDYLLKPVTYSRFIKTVERVKQEIMLRKAGNNRPNNRQYVLLKGGRKYRQFKIYLDEIDYVAGTGHYLTIVVKGEKKLVIGTMKDAMQYLPASRFVQVHKSYIVPLDRIAFIDLEELGLRQVAQSIPISRTYRSELLRLLKGGGD